MLPAPSLGVQKNILAGFFTSTKLDKVQRYGVCVRDSATDNSSKRVLNVSNPIYAFLWKMELLDVTGFCCFPKNKARPSLKINIFLILPGRLSGILPRFLAASPELGRMKMGGEANTMSGA